MLPDEPARTVEATRMLFPESKRVVYQKNPLTEVICQLRFPTVLEIRSEPPWEFQNKIRSAYPIYSKKDQTELLPNEVTQMLKSVRVSLPTPIAHTFSQENPKRFITLSEDFLAISNNDYRRWEEYRTEIIRAKEALETVYSPAFYSRVGLRYVNTIEKRSLDLAEEPWDKLVNPALAGLLAASNVRGYVHETRTEAVIRLPGLLGGFVTLRHGLVRGGDDQPDTYRIDLDCFTQERSDGEHVTENLDTFNRLIGNLFRWATSLRLHEALQPMDID